MSVTFQVDLDYTTLEKEKVYMDEVYPDMPADYFDGDPYVLKEEGTGRYFEMRDKIDFVHEVNMSNRNFDHILSLIDTNMAIISRKNDNTGSIKSPDLYAFQRKVMLVLNRSDEMLSKHEIEKEEQNNFVSMGMDVEYIKSRLTSLLEVIKNAKANNKDVFWS